MTPEDPNEAEGHALLFGMEETCVYLEGHQAELLPTELVGSLDNTVFAEVLKEEKQQANLQPIFEDVRATELRLVRMGIAVRYQLVYERASPGCRHAHDLCLKTLPLLPST